MVIFFLFPPFYFLGGRERKRERKKERRRKRKKSRKRRSWRRYCLPPTSSLSPSSFENQSKILWICFPVPVSLVKVNKFIPHSLSLLPLADAVKIRMGWMGDCKTLKTPALQRHIVTEAGRKFLSESSVWVLLLCLSQEKTEFYTLISISH